jgi:hypothetical protein
MPDLADYAGDLAEAIWASRSKPQNVPGKAT